MKCFNHNDTDGVGVCRICGKALCKDCAVPGAMGITCKGDCEKSAKQMGDSVAVLKSRQQMVKKFTGYYVLGLGILFGLMSLMIGGDGLLRYFIIIPAVAFVVWGVMLIRKNGKR